MARRRATIAALGTTGVLVGLALLLLAVVGAFLAFRGSAGNGALDDAEGVSLGDGRLVKAAPPSFATAAAAPGAAASGGLRRHARTLARRAGSRDAQAVAGVRRVMRAGGVAGSGPAGSGNRTTLPSHPGSAPTAVSERVADVVKGVTDGSGGDLGQTAAPVGQALRDTGNAVSETVRDLGAGAAPRAKAKLPAP
jgi:hypothetical protein